MAATEFAKIGDTGGRMTNHTSGSTTSESAVRTKNYVRFTMIILFALYILCVALSVMVGIREYPGATGFASGRILERDKYAPAVVTTRGTTSAASVSVSSVQTVPAAVSRLERVAMYKDRYNYQIPESYEEHSSRDKLCGTGPHYDTYFQRGTKERSANDEDRTIYELFFKKAATKNARARTGAGAGARARAGTHPFAPKGNIVEMGAFNGVQEANSRFFETCLGWNTLLVEGNPSMFRDLVRNRPHAHRFNFAPSCSEEDERTNKTVSFDGVRRTNAGLRLPDGSVTTAYANDPKPTVEVPCGSLTKVLLDVFPGGHVSFFSLDVEGSEPSVLEHIDLEKVFVEIFIVENLNQFCQKVCKSRDKFRQILTERYGYVLFDNVVAKSDLFVHPLSEHLKKITYSEITTGTL